MSRHDRRRAGRAFGLVVVAVMGLAGSCRTVPRTEPQIVPTAPPAAVDLRVPPPVLRVGVVVDAARASVAADSGVVLTPRGAGAREERVARATFTAEAPAAADTGRFRVQVASLTDPTAARDAGTRAQAIAGQPSAVRWNPETRTHQVRVGAYATRPAALEAVGKLHAGGLPGSFVVEDAPAGSGRIRLLETGREYDTVLLAPADATDTLTIDGAPYRGLVEVLATAEGTVTVVNVVNLEDYLRGVVPNELSPSVYPQIEAQKAQAVAARTYALRNKGQFQSKGYDICATPTCQVYRGKGTENPLSDRAVAETRGVVASYRGGLVNALYTSTCGGHTEDGSNIFEGEDTPYLRGVACLPEKSAAASIRTLETPRAFPTAEGLNRDAALLIALDVLDKHFYSTAALQGPATEGELRGWTQRALAAAHRKGCTVDAKAPLTRRASFFRHLVGTFCWDERATRLLAPEDASYLLKVEDARDLTNPEERSAVALLIQEGVLSPFADNTLQPGAPVTRAQAVSALAQAVAKVGAPALVSAEFRGLASGSMTIAEGEAGALSEEKSYPVDSWVRLFRALNGTKLAASELSLTAGDRVRLVVQGGTVAFLEAEQSRLGPAADRTSRYYRWEVRLSPAEVAQAVSRYGQVGTVKDVVPRRLGVSGRVVELAVLGTSSELVLTGLKVRWGLGLRENLFVVDRELDGAGDVARFVFTGKGWGHGVGLCQVGASGMAQAGATYDQILKHYYSGINVGPAGGAVAAASPHPVLTGGAANP
jgi:peptidoglycan hydrolase-like amidase